MKRSLFFILGILFIIILLGIWIYVLFFGTPKNIEDTFNTFGFGDTTDTELVFEEPTPPAEPVVDVTSTDRLRQLTTTPIIGYQEVQKNASSSPMIYYIESGTGHIFSIDITTGEERRISGTTIPSSKAAVISPNGQFVMIQSGSGSNQETTLGKLENRDNLSTQPIGESIVSFSATTDNTFLYAVQTGNTLIGKHFYPISNVSETIFTIPFREAVVQWGSTAASNHYIYPKSSYQLESFLYQVSEKTLTRLPIDGYGMSAVGNDDFVLFSKQVENNYQTFIYNKILDTENISPLSIIPEKCFFSVGDYSELGICAATLTEFDSQIPDTWYQGKVTYADRLWEINPNFRSATQLVDTKGVSGREIDITNLTLNETGTTIYFTNKLDNTLWLYERIPLVLIDE